LETVLNISGGYKAIVPIITLIRQLEEVPLLYNYETSQKTKSLRVSETSGFIKDGKFFAPGRYLSISKK